tara:strand:+ start:262 stop:810 length:549 start_codon:yes stop_codon:yes gene_type:complete
MYRSAVVIGATGMMSGVAEYLVQRAHCLSFTARTSQSLNSLSQRLSPFGSASGIKVDWNKRAEFLSGLSKLCENGECPDIVVAWLHDDTLGPEIASVLARGQKMAFFQVRGSSAARPMTENSLEIPCIKGLSYHEVILGFQIEANRSRWLSHDEITAGVVEAIEHSVEASVVGVVAPWAMRP